MNLIDGSHSENLIRVGLFALTFLMIAGAETWRPYRVPPPRRWGRWLRHIGLTFSGTILIRLFLPLTAVQFADWVQGQGWGLFNFLSWPTAIEFICAVAVLDLAVYAQHVASHHIPILWRLHRVHHADVNYDLSTGIRFHPIEIFLSMCFKFLVIWVLGASATAVLVFEVLLNSTALFNHANFSLPKKWDRIFRWTIVPPDMHRIHHSQKVDETNSNFGFNLPIWDRLFKTYRENPVLDPQDMPIGLQEYNATEANSYWRSLLIPFKSK